MRRLVLGLATCLPFLAACGGATAWLAGEPPPKPTGEERMSGAAHGLVGRGTYIGELSQAQGQTFMVARTAQEWATLWALVGRTPPAPLGDGLMALAIFVGARTAGGYQVDILRIGVEGVPGQRDRLVVEYREIVPEGFAPMVMTSPYAVVLVDRSDAPVRFVKRP